MAFPLFIKLHKYFRDFFKLVETESIMVFIMNPSSSLFLFLILNQLLIFTYSFFFYIYNIL